MYFYKHKGKQHLDMQGTLLVTRNGDIVRRRVSSAGPSKIENVLHCDVPIKATFKQKMYATLRTLAFIWGKARPCDIRELEPKKPAAANETDADA